MKIAEQCIALNRFASGSSISVKYYDMADEIDRNTAESDGDDAGDGILAVPAQAEQTQTIEDDTTRVTRLASTVRAAKNGVELNAALSLLSIGGGSVGISLTMTRAMRVMRTRHPSLSNSAWSTAKNSEKKAIIDCINGLDEAEFQLVKAAVLSKFPAAPVERTAARVVRDTGGRVVDRVALLACALADSTLLPHWQDIADPVAASLRPAVLDSGAVVSSNRKWQVLAETIMAKREGYTNQHAALLIGSHGVMEALADIDPAAGIFVSTPALTMGGQLKQLCTSMRTSYNGLLQRLDKSGFNSDNIAEAYERCGKEQRPKDIGLFFYWLEVKDKDLDFLIAVLHDDECGNGCIDATNTPSETPYMKRKRELEDKEEKRRTKEKATTLEALRSALTSPSGSAGNESLDLSIIEKNRASAQLQHAAADEKRALTLVHQAKLKTEEATARSMTVDRITALMANEVVWNRFTPAQQEAYVQKLNEVLLIGE